MNAPEQVFTFTIHLMKGDPIRFRIRRGINELRNVGSNLENGLKAQYFGVELDGKLVVVPSHNIRSIEIDPSPNALIAHVIRDAEPVGEAS
jgi:hypothetical protein